MITAIEIIILVLLLIILAILILALSFRKSTRTVIKHLFYRIFSKSSFLSSGESVTDFSEKMAGALSRLSTDYVGAIITVEMNDPLTDFVQYGHELNSKFSAEMVFSIFYNKKSPLHDGSMVVRNGKIIAVSCYYPTTNNNVGIGYGARHRAALGISEINDSLTFIVSETTGKISAARYGKLTNLPNEPVELAESIKEMLLNRR